MRWPWTQVFLTRHGQTQWNVQRRRQGQLDSPLTELGVAQAHAHAAHLAETDIDGIFTSPQGRARTTAVILADTLDVPITVVEDLAEVHHGAFAGLTDTELERDYPEAMAHRATDRYCWRFPGGESYADADQRAERALCTVAAHDSQWPLLVAHEMINRMLLGQLLGDTPQEALARHHPNAVIYQIDPAGQRLHEIRSPTL